MSRAWAGILMLILLAGCDAPVQSVAGNPAPKAPSVMSSAPASLEISSRPILPGSKGEQRPILPGSKGDRTHISSLEVQLRLPEAGFQTAFSLKAIQAPQQWTVQVDGHPVRTRLINSRVEGADAIIYFALEDLDVEQMSSHELLFYSPEWIIQAAALVPGFTQEQSSVSEPITPQSTATWLVASKYQRDKGKSVQELSPQDIKTFLALPDITALAEEIRDLYRVSRGKSDPAKSESILKRLITAVQQAQGRIQNASEQNGSSIQASPAPVSDPVSVTPVSSSPSARQPEANSQSNGNAGAQGHAHGLDKDKDKGKDKDKDKGKDKNKGKNQDDD